MKPLSPVDAVAPAFHRMRAILLPPGPAPGIPTPFRFWFFVKITVVAALTQSSFYAASVLFFGEAIFVALVMSGIGIGTRSSSIVAPGNLRAAHIVPAVIGGAFALALWIFLGWLWCRVRFALFDLALYLHGRVGQAWSRYGAAAWRFLGVTILTTLGFLLLLAVTAGPLILRLVLTFRRLSPEQINANPAIIFEYILPLYAVIPLATLVFAIVDAILEDFLLPPMALEDAPIENAFGRVTHFLRTCPGSAALYLLLRFGLQMAFGIAGSIVVFIVLAVLGLGGVGVGLGVYHAFYHAGTAGFALFVLYCCVAGLVVLACYFAAAVVVQGASAVFRQCFAITFYGSHYPHLGGLAEPPPVVPASPPTPPPTVPDTAPLL